MNINERKIFKTKLFDFLIYDDNKKEINDDKEYFEKLLYANYFISQQLILFKDIYKEEENEDD